MNAARKKQILAAEGQFNRRDWIMADLAIAGVYLIGDLTSERSSPPEPSDTSAEKHPSS